MSLCRYADSLGKPGEGVHAPRLFGVAIVDVVLTVLAAALIAYLGSWPFPWVLLACFLAGILAHRLFCVHTTVDRALFGPS